MLLGVTIHQTASNTYSERCKGQMVPAGPLLLYLQRQRNARARDQYSTRFGDNNTWLHVLTPRLPGVSARVQATPIQSDPCRSVVVPRTLWHSHKAAYRNRAQHHLLMFHQIRHGPVLR